MRYKILQDNRGITLLEVVVSVGIFALIVGAVVSIFLTGFRSKDIIYEQLLTQSQGRKLVQDFTDEIRGATYSAAGAYPIVEAGSEQIIFYTNQNSTTTRRVRYFLSGPNLMKGAIEPSGNPPSYNGASEIVEILVESVSKVGPDIFYYYDQNYSGSEAPLSSPVNVSAVRVVEINFQMERDPHLAPNALLMQGKGEIRNLKSN